MIKKNIFLLVVFLLSFSAVADYRGLIVAHIVEPNGHVYRGYDGFDSGGAFNGKEVIYFEQERGQKVSLIDKRLFVDSSTAQKYHMVCSIQDRINDKFEAQVKLFRNDLRFDQKTERYAKISTLIKEVSVVGTLNSENEYVFVDDNLPNFRLRMNIDKIFTKEEILDRFNVSL